MSFLLFVLSAILVYMKISGKIRWSWLTVGAVAIGLVFFTQITGYVSSLFRSITQGGGDDPQVNPNAACGCGPNQLVLVKKRRFFGKDPSDTVTCDQFQQLSSKWYIAGCLN